MFWGAYTDKWAEGIMQLATLQLAHMQQIRSP